MCSIKKNRFGLLGKNISYSFSKGYFTKKFSAMGFNDHTYENFDLQDISQFKSVLENNPHLKGMNVTIPYKEAVIPYLDELDSQAEQIGAVNTIQFTDAGLKGYNTDAFGFKNAILPYLKPYHTQALILGTGGASKAVAFVLDELGVSYTFVSRNPLKNQIGYSDLREHIIREFLVLINCTPLGTFPNIEESPDIPYRFIIKKHVLFDLIYNPEKTEFLMKGEAQGASISNGLRMLELQAERSWEIWNDS
ncbi:MAG: shikimate dehydrogenase [Pricia sp.]|nr:shikimate dehydrogenase [Pricia sp.]